MKILGIDLGTTSTYIYGCAESPSEAPGARQSIPAPVLLPDIGDNTGSIATVVMYENGKPYLAGNIAESEFYSNLAAQPKRRLVSQFKPEIARGDAGAMRAMTDFLHIIRSVMDEYLEADSKIFVGMPSLAREDFSINLGSCFTRAGWPKPVFVRESDAALVSCLQSGTLDIDDVERKCLILDFGGGTCDYTSVENMDVLQNGGDSLYGGRLFDDLFFQVFCRENQDFARLAPVSPYAWYVHWIECKTQKEKFSDFLRPAANAKDRNDDEKSPARSLHAIWFDASGERHDAWIHDYTREQFIRDAENYNASPAMLDVLAPYKDRGGLSAEDRDLAEGRQVGLISWLQTIMSRVDNPAVVSKVVVTGGSSRWYFVPEIAARIFPSASCVPSNRSYEDIAFGLALFPALSHSREKVRILLENKIDTFSARAVSLAREILNRQTGSIVHLCGERIVARDIMPALEQAQKNDMTVADLEKAFTDNIKNDEGLLAIAREKSNELRDKIQNELNYAFRAWLRDNGVLLVPNFVFPAQSIGKDFFDGVSVKVSRLDSLNLMKFTLTNILPIVAGTATAGFFAHLAEPISTVLGGGLAWGSTWMLAKTAPKLLENRKIPNFLLTEKNRRKIAEKNREFIEKALSESMREVEGKMLEDMDRRITHVLESMLGRLTVLNQVTTH